MECLKVQDVICLSIFKCKICDSRLRTPIFEVGGLGNICGRCYERSAYINVTPNMEIKNFLEKLYVPCNFAERGCTFQAVYSRTCDHEMYECRFRNKICPFAYEDQQCEFEYQDSKNLIDHIQKNHTESVLEVKNNSVQVKNPTETHPNSFYLLQADNTFVLLRTMLNTLKERIYYAFYHFYDVGQDDINISSPAFDDWDGNVKLNHLSKVSYKFPTEDTLIVRFPKLKDLNSLEAINIEIRVEETVDELRDEVKKLTISKWAKCKKCFKIVEDVVYCSRCNDMACQKCKSNRNNCCYGCSLAVINLAMLGACTEFLCENAGCNQMIRGDLYDIHQQYQCFKKEYKCLYTNCTFKGFLREYLQHVVETHKSSINQMSFLKRGASIESDYTNGDDIFSHRCSFSEQNELKIKAIKVTEPFWTNDYICVITVRLKSTYQSITIQGDYTTEGYSKTIQLGDTVGTSELLIMETLIRRI